jgi:hypothetical protein
VVVIPKLTDAGKEDLALALILLKDFRTDGKFDSDYTIKMIEFAKHLGILDEYNRMLSRVPPMKIVPR